MFKNDNIGETWKGQERGACGESKSARAESEGGVFPSRASFERLLDTLSGEGQK